MASWMLTGIIAAQSTDMQYTILLSNITNREIKRRFRSVDTVVETSPDVRRKLLVHACIIWLPAITRSCAWIRLSSPSSYVTDKSERACGKFQPSIWKRKGNNGASLGTKQLSSITHPLVSGWGIFRCCKLTCHQAEISWERPLWKKSTSGIWKFFYWHALYKHSWLQFVDAASSCWTLYLAENDSAPWMARQLRVRHSPIPLVESEGCQISNQHV